MSARLQPGRADRAWLRALRVYLAVLMALMLAWEVAQLPLYTIWREASAGDIAFAVLHCTAGDALIGMGSLGAALRPKPGRSTKVTRNCAVKSARIGS